MRIIHLCDRASETVAKTRRSIAIIMLWLWSTFATPVNSDSLNHWPEPTLQDSHKGIHIQNLLRLEIMWISTDEFKLYMNSSEQEYYITILSNKSVWFIVGAILSNIEKETGIRFWGLDIPVITDLVMASKSWDMKLWEEEYNRVIEGYPSLHPSLITILTKYGCNPYDDKI